MAKFRRKMNLVVRAHVACIKDQFNSQSINYHKVYRPLLGSVQEL